VLDSLAVSSNKNNDLIIESPSLSVAAVFIGSPWVSGGPSVAISSTTPPLYWRNYAAWILRYAHSADADPPYPQMLKRLRD